MAEVCIKISEMNIFDEFDAYVVGDIVYKKSSTLGPRIQGGLQLMFVYSGSACITVDGRERVVEAGEMTFLMPDHVEYFEFSKTSRTHHGWCTALFRNRQGCAALPAEKLAATFKTPPLIRSLTDRGIGLRHQQTPSAQALYRHIAEVIFCEAFHAAGYPARQETPLPEPVRKACEWMELNYEQPCTLEDVAHAAGITGAHLIRLFNEYLDQTPMRRLWAVRCDNGRRLLAETGLSISEIAWQCGYKTPYHFSREFKARNGLSPRAYRNKKWQR
jgi:AraC-like DNA-binding protein